MIPSSFIRYVVRSVPMYLRPHIDFSPHVPKVLCNSVSVSAMSVKGRECFEIKFWCDFSESVLTPIMV